VADEAESVFLGGVAGSFKNLHEDKEDGAEHRDDDFIEFFADEVVINDRENRE